jgi:signal transduction histidine kinase
MEKELIAATGHSDEGQHELDPGTMEGQLQALVRVSERLSSTLLLDDILDLVLGQALQHTGACGGRINLVDADDGRCRPYLSAGKTTPTPELDRRALAQQEIVVAHNVPGERPAVIIVPILFEGTAAGLISLSGDKSNAFHHSDATFAKALSNHAAVAIGNARRFAKMKERNTLLQQRTQQIEHFLESSRVFHSERRLEDVYEELVYAIQEGVGFNVVLLSLVDQGSERIELRRVSAAGLPLDRLQQLQQTTQSWQKVEQLIRHEYRLGGAYFVPSDQARSARAQLDVHQVADLFPAPGKSAADASASTQLWNEDDLFFIPLRDSQGKPLGLISLTAPIDGRRPDLNTARVLEVFANQAASAIENVRLFHNIRDYALQLQQLHNVSQQTLREPDFHEKLRFILDGLQIAGWRRATLTLRDESFNGARLVTAGLSPEEQRRLQQNLLPPEVWHRRFEREALQRFRRGNCFFLPEDHPWSRPGNGDLPPEHGEVETDASWQAGTILYRPLYDRDQKPIGLLGLADPEEGRQPDENALQTIDLYAQLVISVIENYKLFSEMQRRSRELQTLFEASSVLAGTLKQNAILTAMGEHMLQAVNASAYTVYALRRDKTETVVLGSRTQSQTLEQERMGSRSGIEQMALAKTVMETGEPASGQIRAGELGEASSPEKTYSVAMLPLPLGGEIFGLVQIVADGEHYHWNDARLQLLGAIANQASSALETDHLMEELDERVAQRTGTLAEEVAKIQSILESIADGVLVAEAGGKVVMANMPTARILATPRERLIGISVYDLMSVFGDAANRWVRTIRTWAEQPDEIEPHTSLKDQMDIEERVVSVHVSPVFADDDYFGTISIFRDVTKEVEVDRMKSEFVSTVSHELRTPMTSIKGYVDLLLMGAAGELGASQHRFLEVIKKNAERLKILVDDLLDISRIETGKTQLDLQPVNLSQFVEKVNSEHIQGRIQHENKDVTVTTSVPAGLPYVNGDPEKIMRIMTNLVDNALNYTPEGGEIEIAATTRDDYVYVSISDTGIGISSENQERIFERFFRAEAEEVQQLPGTGLGLSIVHSLVEMHGGELTVDSELGEGSTFTFSLPCADQGQ